MDGPIAVSTLPPVDISLYARGTIDQLVESCVISKSVILMYAFVPDPLKAMSVKYIESYPALPTRGTLQ